MNFKRKLLSLLLLLSMIMSTVAGCAKPTGTSTTSTPEVSKAPSSAPAVTLTISAAASLTESMEEIKKLYTAEKSNVTIVYNFGASGSLQQQIEQGAPADIFLSAAPKQMDALDAKSLILKDTRVNLLENKVALIIPKDGTGITDFKDVTSDKIKKLALGEPKSVPVGQYSEEVFTKLGILDAVKPKAVYAKDVKEVLTWVESGNADAGIVYSTDAKASTKIKVVAEAPTGSHSPILYPAAVIKDSKNLEAAKDFMKFISSAKCKAVYEKYGFTFLAK
jgi:molybdate transport system substrate-binding protein